MKVIVCGSIGYGGIEEIKEIQDYLREKGFEVLDQLELTIDLDDFRDKKELWSEIVKRDIEYCEKADVIVFLVKYPSFGAMAEVVISAMKGKKVIAYCPDKVKSPWPLYFSTCVAKSKEELIRLLLQTNISKSVFKIIPNVYGKHEMELKYKDFTCICPVTGMRDIATITIKYIPKDKLIEYESLKDYFESFKDKKMHHEAVVEKIYADVMKFLDPEFLEVIAEFEERSGVKAKVRKTYGLSR